MGCCGMRQGESENESIENEAIFNSEQYEIKRQEDIKNYKYFILHYSLDNYEVEDIKNF
jgi:hypothetical protein